MTLSKPKKYDEKFLEKLSTVDKDSLIGLSYRLLENPNEVIDDASSEEDKAFKSILYELLKQHPARIKKILGGSPVSEERMRALIQLINKSKNRSSERDLYSIEMWTKAHSIEELSEILEFILYKTYIHKDITKISEFVDIIQNKGIDITKSQLMTIFYFFNEAIIKDIGIRQRSPEKINEKLKNLGCPSDIRETICALVRENKEDIINSAIRKDLNLLISKIAQIAKKFDEVTDTDTYRRSQPSDKYTI